MHSKLSSLKSLSLVLVALTACARQTSNLRQPDPAYGRYLVEHVGMCQDCHSPRNDKGEFQRAQWLHGATLPFQPTVPMPWAPAAPPIAGLPSLTDAEAVHFLTKGELPGGRRPRPPMPEFRFDARDAADVVAYLRSLRPAAGSNRLVGAAAR